MIKNKFKKILSFLGLVVISSCLTYPLSQICKTHCQQTVVIKNSKSLNTTKTTEFKKPSYTIDLKSKKSIIGFPSDQFPAYINKETKLFILNFILDNKDYFFNNCPDIEVQDIDIKDVSVDSFKGIVSFEMTIKRGYNDKGEFEPLSLGYRNVTINGFEPVQATEIHVDVNAPIDILPSEFDKDYLNQLLHINSKKIMLCKQDTIIGCNYLYEFIDSLGTTYDASGNEIFIAEGNDYIQEVFDENIKLSWNKTFKVKTNIYTILRK